MTRDSLTDLLHRADAAASAPALGGLDLARGARSILRRRRRTRRRVAGACCVILGAAGLWWGLPTSTVTPERGDRLVQRTPKSAPTAEIRHRILELEADAAMRLASRLMDGEQRRVKLAAYRRQAATPDPIRRVRLEAEATARMMVFQADQLRAHAASAARASRAYRRTVELFPNTHWAGVAQERLAESEQKNGQKPKATRENSHDAQVDDRDRRMAAAVFESGGRGT